MINRRFLLATIGAFAVFPAATARAFEFKPYDDNIARKAIASGRPVILHVYAPWCLQCHIQASHLDSLAKDATYDRETFFRVDYDNQKEVVARLDCPRSTLIAYKGGKEVARMSWGVSRESVENVLRAAN